MIEVSMAAWPGRTSPIIRIADCRRMPWKNGGGETIEILAAPDGAGLDAFDWRVSLAQMTHDGPFSAFPGIDRTITVLEGDGLELSVGAAPPLRLTTVSDPFAFPADAPCVGHLSRGPVTNLNVMSERTGFRHAVTRLASTRTVSPSAEGLVLVVCTRGTLSSPVGTLSLHDTLVVSAPAPMSVRPVGPLSAGLTIAIEAQGGFRGDGRPRDR